MAHTIRNGERTLGEVSSLDDVRTMRERIRGHEYQWGVISNALDVVLGGGDAPLAYLSPRDRRLAEAEIAAIRGAIEA
ncbi:MAG: hypothetical protein NDJ92_08580 [Thermoanaerobaculia bacterium]|nr:hypothetical protein [Thermoanaerobaculia bacterium]